jgi:hypothetical protein
MYITMLAMSPESYGHALGPSKSFFNIKYPVKMVFYLVNLRNYLISGTRRC